MALIAVVVKSLLTIYGLALGHVAIVGIGEEAIPISTDDAFEVAAFLESVAGLSRVRLLARLTHC